MELNFEDLEMKKWNKSTDRAQKVDEKNGAICLVIMLTRRVSHQNVKNGLFFVFSADNSTKSVTVWAKYLSASKKSYWVLSENGMANGFEVTARKILRVEI